MPNLPQLPLELLNSLHGLPGFDATAFVEAHREENRITSLRLNPFKPVDLDFDLGQAVPWCSAGRFLDARPYFTHDPLFHAGCYYVQEAGSMFIDYVLRQCVDFSKPLKVLDACAAPGGKSTLLSSLLNDKSLLVANEVVKNRAEVLAMNLSKWGVSNAVVTNQEPKKLAEAGALFDVLVVDAPCSGSGLFRKQPEAVEEWSLQAVQACSVRQKNILTDLLPTLKEGGILVYSTCSYSVEENEAVVEDLINSGEMQLVQFEIPAVWGLVDSGKGFRFYPHLTKSEGFFCAVLQKTGSDESSHRPRKTTGDLLATKAEQVVWKNWIQEEVPFVMKKNERFYGMNELVFEWVSRFEKQFYFKKAGVCLGEIKGKDVVPDQELAWSVHLNKDFAGVELDKESALLYLKKEKFNYQGTVPGFGLMRYKERGLGWAKLLPNRVNNYYPQEYRILQ